MDAIFSIRPFFASPILAGIKKFELRPIAPSKPIERIWLYSSSPVQQVVGYFTPGKIHLPMQWRALLDSFGPENLMGCQEVSEAELENFFGDKLWRAIEILDLVQIEPPINPRTDLALGYLWMAPQSFRYCGAKEQAALRVRVA